ncbi:RNA-binding protein 34 [Clonorchis sinensis]|uniref:RNA-binding protein 34 n=1 Tax=Clonorchis sinensis TaxID=79923 RepID=A0A419QAS2_CLOSI|nr:RNA-binding protein 34 [Clonorchis sinensis]
MAISGEESPIPRYPPSGIHVRKKRCGSMHKQHHSHVLRISGADGIPELRHSSICESPSTASAKRSKNKEGDTNHKVDKTFAKRAKRDASFDDLLDVSSRSGTSDGEEEDIPNAVRDRSAQRSNRHLRNEHLKRTLFVGNLPPGLKKTELRKLFDSVIKQDSASVQSNCRVESVRFRGVVPVTGGTGKLARKRAVIQGEFSAGVSQNMIAYVVLTSTAGIPAGLSLNGHWLQTKPISTDTPTDYQSSGKHIRVDRALRHRPVEQFKQSVFLGNLPFDVQEEEVRSAMSKFGPIANVRLIRDKETGAVKGFGFVQYTDPAAISLAIRSSESVSVRGRPIRIQEWKAAAKSGRAEWKPKLPKTVLLHSSPKNPIKSTSEKHSVDADSSGKKRKLLQKLRHAGQVKGVTLPSNLRGEQRERYLQKRLIKKRKRQIRRQQQQAQSKPVTVKTSGKVSKKTRTDK